METKSLKDRLMAKVKVYADGCWFWTGVKNKGGYGQIGVGRASRPAHRVSYELFKGPIPDGLVIDHLCRHPYCVNPDHLEAVTERENILRSNGASAVNARKTHCKRGHEFTPENTRAIKGGGRRCLTCAKAHSARYLKGGDKFKPAPPRELSTHCQRGHERNQENTRWYRGVRYCRACTQLLDADRRKPAWAWKPNHNGSKQFCKHGHEYTSENTSRDKLNRRVCLTCHRDYERARRARLKAA